MAENKLIELFNVLTGPEKRACTIFLQSPFFNNREDVSRLWEWLLSDREGLSDPKQAFAGVYPDAPFDESQWRHVQSFLLQQIERFLAQRAMELTPVAADLHLAEVYRNNGLGKHLGHVFRRAGERLDRMPRDNEYYHLLYRLEWERYAAVESQTRSRDNNLAVVSRALDTFLIGSKLRLACLMESHKAVYKVDYDTALLKILLDHVHQTDLLHVPVIALYYHCYRALTEGSEGDFRQFRSEFEAQSQSLPPDESRTLLLLSVNYCIRRLNTGENRYIREAFDLYRIGLETRVLIEHGRLGRFAFKNIVALGLRLEAFEWVENFIRQFSPLLEEKYRAAHRDYNLAKMYYAKKDYGRAMPLLARVDENDLLLNLDSRIMLLKMYYETGEWDALDALLSSFKILLLRKKRIIGYHSANYLSTLRFIHRLTRLNLNDKKAVGDFRAAVARDKTVIEKEWLLEIAGV